MSEHAPHQPEHHEQHERHEHVLSHEKEANKAEHETHQSAERAKHDVEAIHHKIEKEAKSAKEIKVGTDNEKEKQTSDHYMVTKELKQEALKRSLQRARKHMTATGRAFSKTIHQPVVDAVSKVSEKTIARPNGILAGAIVALIGTSYVLYSAKHYGYRYNYLVVFILFAGGYLVGLAIEILVYMFKRLRS